MLFLHWKGSLQPRMTLVGHFSSNILSNMTLTASQNGKTHSRMTSLPSIHPAHG